MRIFVTKIEVNNRFLQNKFKATDTAKIHEIIKMDIKTLYMMSVCTGLLSKVNYYVFGYKPNLSMKIGNTTFHIYSTIVTFGDAIEICERNGFKIATLKNREVAKMFEREVFPSLPGKPIGL